MDYKKSDESEKIMGNMENKKEKIMNTALQLILEKGYQSTPMSKISKESGVAIGTIYHHFSSKEDLVSQIYRKIKVDMLSIMNINEMKEYNEEEFKIMVEGYINYALSKPLEFEFVERYYNSPIISLDIRKETKVLFEKHVDDMFEKLKNNNLINDIPNEMIIRFLLGSLSGLIRNMEHYDIEKKEANINDYLRLICSGVIK